VILILLQIFDRNRLEEDEDEGKGERRCREGKVRMREKDRMTVFQRESEIEGTEGIDERQDE
jgi:hypothetical protein